MDAKEFETALPSSGQRGPAEHERRQQILTAASQHFRHYGFKKTTVGDLAKAIGLSSAYVYKFFESKQAIGEAICLNAVMGIIAELERISDTSPSPSECMRRIFRGLASYGSSIFLEDRKIHDLVVASFEERWKTHDQYDQELFNVIRKVLVRGRESGEFERKTPLDETTRAICKILQPFYHPVLLVENLDHLDEDATAVANLVLRSLAI